ncbi:hypothetical protein B0H17DRAFT_646337 [Mycena rosella]|uniref:RING-type domain-containing protein n=1 Tax=Mycena rosella TaxID=1033263 RepID=A0AAD7DDU6_MYCRO|nr:hypothetical protein B0H17DRAFT_646337 [Mycena rosella]
MRTLGWTSGWTPDADADADSDAEGDEDAEEEDVDVDAADEGDMYEDRAERHPEDAPPPPAPQAQAQDASRTFLIYVIGGYYPPEHGILSAGGGGGGAEGMGLGFEALLDLGELLGPPRPPTASKADIARAGLAVLRRDALAAAPERVLESCVERCLICLDDYTEVDEIRLLSCRHAFHRGCVDRWLETGRNNCPACRTKGVPTDGPSNPAM